MSITAEKMESVLKELGLTVQGDGNHFIHSTSGRYAPVISTIVTIDEDGGGATVMASLGERVPPEKRATVCELLNLVHGQGLWNVRFHLDDAGRVFSVGKILLWGKPLNPLQVGDIFFSQLVSTDRLFPCLVAINEESRNAADAFERFFLKEAPSGSPDDSGE